MTRKIVSGSPHREVGVINPRWLLDHPVHHESHLERRFVMVALACPVVIDIVHQPITIDLNDGRKYTPDFYIKYEDGDEAYIEVKPRKFVPNHQDTLDTAAKAFAQKGKKYLLVTDEEIDKDGLGKRAILLMRYARMTPDAGQVLKCVRLVEEMASNDPKVKDLIEEGLSDAEIWSLVARHQLRIPAGIKLDADTHVTINREKENCHDQLCAWFGIEAR